MKKILANIDSPQLSPFCSLKVRLPRKEKVFIVESRPAVLSLLKTDLKIISCLTTQRIYKEFCVKIKGFKKRKIPAFLLDKKDIEKLIGFRFHQGILIAVKIPKKKSLKQLLKDTKKPYLFAALNNVHDSQNVGLIIRNSAAFSAGAIIVDRLTHEPFYRKVVRVSMGSIFKTRIAYEDNLEVVLKDIKKKQKVKIIVPLLKGARKDIGDVDFSGNVCFVFGNEAEGVSKKIIDLADETVRIPHCFKNIQSLNVACASAIFLYEADRQRRR